MVADEIHIGVLAASSPKTSAERLEDLGWQLGSEVAPVLERASGVRWIFHREEPTHLPEEKPRRPSDFLGEASLRMVEGPYDAIVVITDVGLVSGRQQLVPGLASPVARVAVLSTRDFRIVLALRREAARKEGVRLKQGRAHTR